MLILLLLLVSLQPGCTVHIACEAMRVWEVISRLILPYWRYSLESWNPGTCAALAQGTPLIEEGPSWIQSYLVHLSAEVGSPVLGGDLTGVQK